MKNCRTKIKRVQYNAYILGLPFRWFYIDEIDDASQDMIIGDRDDDDDDENYDDENYNDKNDDHDDEIDEDDDSWAFKAMQHR